MTQFIPQVDLAQFLSSDPKEQQHFVAALGAAFSDIGFVALRGHFLSPELVTKLYTQIEAFFQLSEDQKMQYHVPGQGGQRG